MTPGTTPGPAPVGSLASFTVLAEGPFTSANGTPVTTTLKVPCERLQNGPVGARIGLQLASQGSATGLTSLTVDAGGWEVRDRQPPADLEELLADRAFLAQNVYAVASATLATFETTLGRRMPWRSGHRLLISIFDPISFAETGYDRRTGIIRFGHHRDGRSRHHIPLAMYHDLVAHELTHALLDGYRPRWADGAATADQFALHEALADLVAMLSVFATPERVEQQIATASRDAAGVTRPLSEEILQSGLFGLADGLFSRGAARRPLSMTPPASWRNEPEPHLRGEVIVRAALEALHQLWWERLKLPGGRSSRYQVALAGSLVGKQMLAMLIRGLAYMPPVDPTWDDLLRGIIASDLVMVPSDTHHYRDALRGSFGRIGVAVGSDDTLPGIESLGVLAYPVRLSALASDPEEVHRFIWENPSLIDAAMLDPDTPVTVDRVRPSVRVSPDGFVVSEIGASFAQEVHLTRRAASQRLGIRAAGDLTVRGGGLLRFDEGGRLSFAAIKTVMDPQRQQAKYAVQQAAPDDVYAGSVGIFHRPGERSG